MLVSSWCPPQAATASSPAPYSTSPEPWLTLWPWPGFGLWSPQACSLSHSPQGLLPEFLAGIRPPARGYVQRSQRGSPPPSKRDCFRECDPGEAVWGNERKTYYRLRPTCVNFSFCHLLAMGWLLVQFLYGGVGKATKETLRMATDPSVFASRQATGLPHTFFSTAWWNTWSSPVNDVLVFTNL